MASAGSDGNHAYKQNESMLFTSTMYLMGNGRTVCELHKGNVSTITMPTITMPDLPFDFNILAIDFNIFTDLCLMFIIGIFLIILLSTDGMYFLSKLVHTTSHCLCFQYSDFVP